MIAKLSREDMICLVYFLCRLIYSLHFCGLEKQDMILTNVH